MLMDLSDSVSATKTGLPALVNLAGDAFFSHQVCSLVLEFRTGFDPFFDPAFLIHNQNLAMKGLQFTVGDVYNALKDVFRVV